MPSGDLQQLSQVLRQERVRSGLTVRQVAELAGLVPSTVSRLESGLSWPSPGPFTCNGSPRRWASRLRSCTPRPAI